MSDEEDVEELVKETIERDKNATRLEEESASSGAKPRRRRTRKRAKPANPATKQLKSKIDTGHITYIRIDPNAGLSYLGETDQKPLIVMLGKMKDGTYPKVPSGWVGIGDLAYDTVIQNYLSPMYIRQSTLEEIVRTESKRMNLGVVSSRNKAMRSKVKAEVIPFSKTKYEAMTKKAFLTILPGPTVGEGELKQSRVTTVKLIEGEGQNEDTQAFGSYAVSVVKKANSYEGLRILEDQWRQAATSDVWPDVKFLKDMERGISFALVDEDRARETRSEQPLIVANVETALKTEQVPMTIEDLPDIKERYISVPTELWGYRLLNMYGALSRPALMTEVVRVPLNLQSPSIVKLCSAQSRVRPGGRSGVETTTILDRFAYESNSYVIKAGAISRTITLSYMTPAHEALVGHELLNAVKTRLSYSTKHEADSIELVNFAITVGSVVPEDVVLERSPLWTEGGVHVPRSPAVDAFARNARGNADMTIAVVVKTGFGKTLLTGLLWDQFGDMGNVIVEAEKAWYPHLKEIDRICKAHLDLPKVEGNGNVIAALGYEFGDGLTILNLLTEYLATRWQELLVPLPDETPLRRTLIILTPLFQAAMGRSSTVVSINSLNIEQDFDNRENELPASFRRILSIAYDNDLLGALAPSSHLVMTMKELVESFYLSERFVPKSDDTFVTSL